VSGISQSTLTALALQGLIVLLILRRSFQIARGTPASIPRLLLLPAFLVLIFAIAELQATVLVPWTFPGFLVLDIGVALATATVVARLAEPRVEVFRDPAGHLMFRVGLLLPLVYVGLFVARIGVELAYFPALLNFGSSGAAGASPPYSSQVALVAIDVLFALSTGFLTGPSVAVLQRLRGFARADSAPAAPRA
jgi:hypothetical protein